MQPGWPPLYAGVLGPKAAARAARWAVGITGFSLNLDVDEIERAIRMADHAWRDAGRPEPPRFLTACFFALGDDADVVLRRFTHAYFRVFGDEIAEAMAETASLFSEEALAETLDRVATSTRTDEVILVPASVDPALAQLAARVAGERC